jgi:hypothetical protein
VVNGLGQVQRQLPAQGALQDKLGSDDPFVPAAKQEKKIAQIDTQINIQDAGGERTQ